jgi:hypothetical protein
LRGAEKVKLADHAPKWHKLWSVRLAVLSAALGALEMSLPLWQGLVPANVFAALSTITAASAAVARVIKQEGLKDDV